MGLLQGFWGLGQGHRSVSELICFEMWQAQSQMPSCSEQPWVGKGHNAGLKMWENQARFLWTDVASLLSITRSSAASTIPALVPLCCGAHQQTAPCPVPLWWSCIAGTQQQHSRITEPVSSPTKILFTQRLSPVPKYSSQFWLCYELVPFMTQIR